MMTALLLILQKSRTNKKRSAFGLCGYLLILMGLHCMLFTAWLCTDVLSEQKVTFIMNTSNVLYNYSIAVLNILSIQIFEMRAVCVLFLKICAFLYDWKEVICRVPLQYKIIIKIK